MSFICKNDGFYDYEGNALSIDDIIAQYVNDGGKVERKVEEKEIYSILEDGSLSKETKICEVVTFR